MGKAFHLFLCLQVELLNYLLVFSQSFWLSTARDGITNKNKNKKSKASNCYYLCIENAEGNVLIAVYLYACVSVICISQKVLNRIA